MHTMNIINFKGGVQVNPPEPPLHTGLNVFLKLPPLKLTTQSSEATSKIIQRARHPIGDAEVSTDRELPDDVLNVGGDDAAVIEPSHHEIEAKSSINGWSNIRNRLLTAFMESEHLPDGQVCIICSSCAEARCLVVVDHTLNCRECFCSQHNRIMLHRNGRLKYTICETVCNMDLRSKQYKTCLISSMIST